MMKPKARNRRHAWRAWKFALLRRVAIPVLLPFLRLWVRTLRIVLTPGPVWRELGDPGMRVCVAGLHGHVFAGMAAMTRRPFGRPRPVATLVSPSRDGLLQADVGRAFGMLPISGSSSKRGVSGLMALRRAIGDGRVAAVAVDGPRGPRAIPKGGVFQLAEMTQARLYVVAAGASPAIRLGTWDRYLVPLPFAKVRLVIRFVRDYGVGAGAIPRAEAIESMHRMFAEMLEDLGEPVDDLAGGEKG